MVWQLPVLEDLSMYCIVGVDYMWDRGICLDFLEDFGGESR